MRMSHTVTSATLCLGLIAAATFYGPASPARADGTSQPVISSVDTHVTSTAGGALVRLHGSGLTSDATVKIAGRSAEVRSASGGTMTVIAPAAPRGVAHIQVTTAGRTSDTNSTTAIAYVDQIPGTRPKARTTTDRTRLRPRSVTTGISDPNLALCVNDQLGLDPSTPPTPEQLSSLTALYCTDRTINSLAGISLLTNLQTLDVGGNTITDVGPLASMTGLKELGLQSNRIADLTPLSALTSLTRLDAWTNPVSSLAPLKSLTNLEYLDVSDTGVSSLEPLTGLKRLISLDANFTTVSSLTPLRSAAGLLELQLWQARASDLTPLAGLTSLRYLDVSANRVTGITTLSRLTRLETLNLEDNDVADATALAGLTRLYSLNLSGNRISSVAPLAKLSALQWLFVQRNRIADLSPLSGLRPNSIEAQDQTVAAPVTTGKYTTFRMADRTGALVTVSGGFASYSGGRITFVHAGTTILSFRNSNATFTGTVLASCTYNIPMVKGDGTGDRIADLYGIGGDGKLHFFRGSATGGVSALPDPWQDAADATALVQIPDVNADKRSDLLTREPDGQLLIRPGLGNGYLGTAKKVGNNWNTMDLITSAGHLTGNSTNFLVARQRSTGDLIRYTLSGSGVGSTTVIGHGWGTMRALIGISDWNGDKRDDLLAVRNDGTLWLYTSSVRGTPNPAVRVGLGWSNFTNVTSPGDISGDSRGDLVAQRNDGVLFAYHLANRRFASPREIGRGLQNYRLIG